MLFSVRLTKGTKIPALKVWLCSTAEKLMKIPVSFLTLLPIKKSAQYIAEPMK